MKLYFSPGACSLSPHIVLIEAGLGYTTEKVDLRSKLTASGTDYRAVNPKGYVPALELEGGHVLTEGPAVVQYLADQAPEKGLAPPNGSFERYQLVSLLNFISVELHKNYSPLFRPDNAEAVKQLARQNLAQRYPYIEQLLEGKEYLLGDRFTVADAYLFTITNWAGKVGVDLAAFPHLQAFQARVAARPAVQQALREEGLLG
jgi:glutathione S-transferase